MNNLSANLRQLRHLEGISQKQLADAIKVAPSSIQMWESGQRRPKYEFLEAIADYFNVSIDALLGNEEPAANKIDNLNRARLVGLAMDIPDDKVVLAYRLIKVIYDEEKTTI